MTGLAGASPGGSSGATSPGGGGTGSGVCGDLSNARGVVGAKVFGEGGGAAFFGEGGGVVVLVRGRLSVRLCVGVGRVARYTGNN